jgi:hypothetical protein
MEQWNLPGDDPNRTLRFAEPLKNLLLRGKKVRDVEAKRMNIRDPYSPASEYPNHVLFGFEPAEDGYQYPIYFVPGSEMVSQSMDPETGNLRTTTQTIVDAGTAATATDDDGNYSEVQSLDPNWMIQTVREAPGLAGDASVLGTGIATREMPMPRQHYWPPVLRNIFVRPIYASAADIYSEVTGYIIYPIWLAYGYNGGCKGTLTEVWTKVKPSFTGDPAWPTTGSAPYIPEPTKLLPRPISFQGTNGFNISIESCLHGAFVFTNDGFVMREPATTPIIWPGTLVLDVDVRPNFGGYLTRYLTLNAPATLDTGLNLSHTSVSSTSHKVTWDVGGSGTVLDVSTSPDFTRGAFLTGQAVPSSGTLEYTITGLTRGQLYFARLRRSALTSNTVQFICEPQSELSLFDASTPITTTLAFATTAVGVAVPKTLTMFNLGVLPLNVTSVAVSGTNAAEFVVAGAPTLVAAGNGEEDFTLTWTPTATGSRVATLTLITDDPDSPLSIALSGTATDPEINVQYAATSYANGDTVEVSGETRAGETSDITLTIQNTGTGNLTVSAGISGTGFTILTNPTSPVAGSGSTDIVLRFAPVADGAHVGVLTLTNNDRNEGTTILYVTAQATAEPNLVVRGPLATEAGPIYGILPSGSTLDMGVINTGSDTRVMRIRLENTGYATLSLASAALSGADTAKFSLGSLSATSLLPAGTAFVDITLDHNAAGSWSVLLTITSNDPDTPSYTMTVNGETALSARAEIQVEQPAGTILTDNASTIDFGSVLLTGGTSVKTFRVRNMGTFALSSLAASTTGTHAVEWSAAGLTASLAGNTGATEPANDDFTLTFDPAGYGPRTATLSIASTDANENPFEVALTGTGVPANALLLGQTADVIIGQADDNDQVNVSSAIVTRGPTASAVSSTGRLAVADFTANRVLIWNTVPTVSGTPADIVLGQTDFVTETSGTSSTKMQGPRSVAWHGANLWVADTDNNRVLMFANPRASGAAATRVLGQTNFTSGSSRSAASFGTQGLSSPSGVCIYSGKLLVVDRGHHRVLIWNKVPTASNTAASVVVGQTNTTNSSTGLTSSTLNTPETCCVTIEGYLAVADSFNSRVLIWNSVPAANGAAASTVLGQVDFTSNAVACTATGMSLPIGVAAAADGGLAVSDQLYHRVMLWYATPGSSGAACHAVLGQVDFTSSSNGTSSGAVMLAPEGLCWSGTSLLVSGLSMKRTMKFSPA